MTETERLVRIQIISGLEDKNAANAKVVGKTFNEIVNSINNNDSHWIAAQFQMLYGKGIINLDVKTDSQGNFHLSIRFRNCPLLTPNAEDELKNLKNL